jgi:hypothetical protein
MSPYTHHTHIFIYIRSHIENNTFIALDSINRNSVIVSTLDLNVVINAYEIAEPSGPATYRNSQQVKYTYDLSRVLLVCQSVEVKIIFSLRMDNTVPNHNNSESISLATNVRN